MGITQNTGASSQLKAGVIDNTAARPASPFEGQVVFQKDTDQLLVWNGTAWVEVASTDGKAPRGQVGVAFRTTVYQPTTSISDYLSVTFTAVAGRYYRYTLFAGNSDADATRTLNVVLTDGSNVALNNTALSIFSGTQTQINTTTVRTETAGSHTRKIRMSTSGGNGSMNSATNIGVFVVEDIGSV